GIISELCGELVEEDEQELKKIDPTFKPEVLGSGWQNTRDPIHECVAKKKAEEEAAQTQPQPAPQQEAEMNRDGSYLFPGATSEEPRDLLGESKDFWNEVDLEDLKR